MASIDLGGLDVVDNMFKSIVEIPVDVRLSAIDAMAEVAEKKVKATGAAMGVRDPESNVHILDKIKHTKPKDDEGGGHSDVTFSGSRTRGKTKISKTRNAEIAFINEYGRRGQPARPFIRQAAEQYADQIAAPGEKIIGDWFEKSAEG